MLFLGGFQLFAQLRQLTFQLHAVLRNLARLLLKCFPTFGFLVEGAGYALDLRLQLGPTRLQCLYAAVKLLLLSAGARD